MKKLVFILTSLTLLGAAATYVGLQTFEPYEVGDEATRNKLNHNFNLIYSGGAFDYTDSTAFIRYLDFILEDGWDFEEGRFGWDSVAGVPAAGLAGGSVLQIGEELVIRGTNKTGSTIYNGFPLYISGAQGNRPTFARADYTSFATSATTLGLATQDIANNANGFGTPFGLVRTFPDSLIITNDVLNVGELLWLNKGVSADYRPDAGFLSVAIGIITAIEGQEVTVLVNPVLVPRLSWLSDVGARGLEQFGDVLVKRDSTWIQDSTIVRASIFKGHILTSVDAAEADAWRNFTGFTVSANETNGHVFELVNDSSVVCLFTGFYSFGGCVHVQNNTGTPFAGVTILSRIYKNSTTEARCSQRGYTTSLQASGEDVLSYNGTDYLEAGDTLRLQYYVSSTDVDFYSNAAFDNQVAATMFLQYIGENF